MRNRLGLGAKVPEDSNDGDLKRQKKSSNEQLRKQLLGSHYKKGQMMASETGFQKVAPVNGLIGSKPRPVAEKREIESSESEEDEGGRTSLGKSKRNKKIIQDQGMDTVTPIDHEHAMSLFSDHEAGTKPALKASNYLDEVLAQGTRKKKRMGKKHRNKDRES